jgi:hypothetical protein
MTTVNYFLIIFTVYYRPSTHQYLKLNEKKIQESEILSYVEIMCVNPFDNKIDGNCLFFAEAWNDDKMESGVYGLIDTETLRKSLKFST